MVIAASTFIVAVVLALCVPISQLTTVSDRTECCCPDPSKCQCPDHDEDRPLQTSMQACHKQGPKAIASQATAFLPPVLPTVDAPSVLAPAVAHVIHAPQVAPPPRRPDAPS